MTWFFLRRGRSASEALTVLDELLANLGNIIGQLSSPPAVAASVYMQWIEDAERRLPLYFDDQAVVDALYSERYWHIRAIGAETARPSPLIQAEVEARTRSLELIRDQLRHYQELLTPAGAELVVVPDTNVLMHGQLFTQMDWRKAMGSETVTLVLPLVVLDELDDKKNAGERGAATTLRALDELVVAGEALQRMLVRQGVTLQLLDQPPGHNRLQNHDDEIVRQSLYFASIHGGPLQIVTRDRGMRVRAESARLRVAILPQEFARTRVEQRSVDE